MTNKIATQVVDLAERAIGTAAAAALATIGTTAAASGVNWVAVGDIAGLAAIVTVLKTLVTLWANGTGSAAGAIAISAKYDTASTYAGPVTTPEPDDALADTPVDEQATQTAVTPPLSAQ